MLIESVLTPVILWYVVLWQAGLLFGNMPHSAKTKGLTVSVGTLLSLPSIPHKFCLLLPISFMLVIVNESISFAVFQPNLHSFEALSSFLFITSTLIGHLAGLFYGDM